MLPTNLSAVLSHIEYNGQPAACVDPAATTLNYAGGFAAHKMCQTILSNQHHHLRV